MDDQQIAEILKAFRDSATHATPGARLAIQNIFEQHNLGHIHLQSVTDTVVYRVCDRNDRIMRYIDYVDNGHFFSACQTLLAAENLLKYPPNPLQDRIVKVTISGPILKMPYDGNAGRRKAHEEEILVPYKCVRAVSAFI